MCRRLSPTVNRRMIGSKQDFYNLIIATTDPVHFQRSRRLSLNTCVARASHAVSIEFTKGWCRRKHSARLCRNSVAYVRTVPCCSILQWGLPKEHARVEARWAYALICCSPMSSRIAAPHWETSVRRAVDVVLFIIFFSLSVFACYFPRFFFGVLRCISRW